MSRKLLIPLLTAVFFTVPAAFGPVAPFGLSGSAHADGKHISDGAAKGQATEGTMKPTKNGTSSKGEPSMAVKGSGVPKNTSKNISDGAAKGQASEGTAPRGKSIDQTSPK